MPRQKAESCCDIVLSNDAGSHKSMCYGEMVCSLVDFKKGTDLTPIISQLPSGWCQVPHWGYMIKGHVDVKYSDGSEDSVKTGDIFYFKPGPCFNLPISTPPASTLLFGHLRISAGILK